MVNLLEVFDTSVELDPQALTIPIYPDYLAGTQKANGSIVLGETRRKVKGQQDLFTLSERRPIPGSDKGPSWTEVFRKTSKGDRDSSLVKAYREGKVDPKVFARIGSASYHMAYLPPHSIEDRSGTI